MTVSWKTVVLAGTLFVTALADAQGRDREISGKVADASTSGPLPQVVVQLKGTQRSVLTDARGQFSLRVPPGDATLVARRIGYRQVSQVVASDASTASIEMTVAATDLNEVVVSGQASGIERRHLATAVTTLSGEDITRVSQQTIEHNLQGKIPGVQISQRTGAPGGGNWVKIRGISTIIAGQTTPLYVVDGVIVGDTYQGNSQSRITAGQSSESPPNRITDLDPNDIETVEVLKGPTAAAIYGSKASMGVILITTRRGKVGRVRWTGSQAFGTSRLAYRHGHRQWSYDDAIANFGSGAAAYFDPTTKQALLDLDYEDLAYGERPLHSDLSVSASGGTVDTRFFLSAAAREEGGIVVNTLAQKYSIRGNVDQVISDRGTLQIGTSLMHSTDDRGVFDNENGPNGIGSSVGYTIPRIPSFLDLRQRPDGSWPVNPFFPSNPLQNAALQRNHDEVWRGLASSQLRLDLLSTPRHTLRLTSVAGLDAYVQRFEVLSPPELQSEAVLANPGRTVVTDHRTVLGNLNLNVVHSWQPSSNLTVTSQAGTQYERAYEDVLLASSANLAGGLEVVNAGASTTFGLNDFRLRVEDFGVFAQTEWLWNDRLLTTVGARADRSSANADVGRFFVYPKASVSYRIGGVRLPVVGTPSALDDVKFRLAFGETGNRPWYGDKYTSVAQGTVGGNTSYRTATATSSADLRPERQREIEGGVDLSLFDARANVELTAYRRHISGILLAAQAPPSTGYVSMLTNIGKLRTHGYEAAISAIPLRRSTGLTWTTRGTFGMTRSMVLRLAGDTIQTRGSRLSDGQIWLRPGHSATEIIGVDTMSADPVRVGDGAPSWTGGWSNELRWGPLSLYALLDHQHGGRLLAGTWGLYDQSKNTADYDVLLDDGRKLGDVRRELAGRITRIRNQDATYTKLREVTLGWDLSPGVSRWFAGASAARLQVSGRNVIWWTKYRGGDPEAENFFGGFDLYQLQRNRELAAYPASRSFWFTVRADF